MNNRGFSLIEVLITITIVALISSVLVPYFYSSLDWTRDKKAKLDLEALNMAVNIDAVTQEGNPLLRNNLTVEEKKTLVKQLFKDTDNADLEKIDYKRLTATGEGKRFHFNQYLGQKSEDSKDRLERQDHWRFNDISGSKGNKTYSDRSEEFTSPNFNQNLEDNKLDRDILEEIVDSIYRRID